MANPEHLKKLVESGRTGWKTWREANPDDVLDLSHAKFAKELSRTWPKDARRLINMRGLNLRNAKLREADFRGTNIDRTDFSFADLVGATFYRTSAVRAIFRGARMQRCTVEIPGGGEDPTVQDFVGEPEMTILDASPAATEFDLRGASFRDCDFTGAILEDADLGAAVLDGSILRFANLTKAILRRTSLIGSDLEGAQVFRSRILQISSESSRYGVSVLPSKIERIQDLVDKLDYLVLNLKTANHYGDVRLYFRGEKDCDYRLMPRIMRNSGHSSSEDIMLSELSIRRPHELIERQPYFQRLVMACHFELPTRLLDTTRNPLVALYYALDSAEDDRDGVFHIFVVNKESVKPFGSDTVSLISNFNRLKAWEKNTLLSYDQWKPSPSGERDWVQGYEGAYRRTITRLNHFVAQEKPYWEDRIDLRDLFRVFVVEPQQQFDRLRAHSGAFMVSAFHGRFERIEVDRWFPGAARYWHLRVMVPHKKKGCLRDQLQSLGITEEYLKADLQSAAHAVARTHERTE